MRRGLVARVCGLELVGAFTQSARKGVQSRLAGRTMRKGFGVGQKLLREGVQLGLRCCCMFPHDLGLSELGLLDFAGLGCENYPRVVKDLDDDPKWVIGLKTELCEPLCIKFQFLE